MIVSALGNTKGTWDTGKVPGSARPSSGNWVTTNELGNELGNKEGCSMTEEVSKCSAAIDFHIQGGNLEELISNILKFRKRLYCAMLKAEWEK